MVDEDEIPSDEIRLLLKTTIAVILAVSLMIAMAWWLLTMDLPPLAEN